MKTNYLRLLFLSMGILIPFMLSAQTAFVKQVVTANGGKFEFAPPYQDYVTLQSYSPASGAGGIIGTIYTQSVQDIVIKNGVAYIAAQDSIIKISMDTYERLAAVADSGLSKLFLFQDKLIVSKQYPLSTFFAEVLDTTDLSIVQSISGIPGDCGGIVAVDDSVYIAVNGGWMGTEGKIAVIETSNWTLTRIINCGTDAAGMIDIYSFGSKLFTINKSSYLTPNLGSITMYDLSNSNVVNTLINRNIGRGAGREGNQLYFGLNYGIGAFNLNTLQVEDSVVIEDPGSATFQYIISAKVEVNNNWIFVNIGDYQSAGTCLVAALNGDSITTYPTGVSSEVIGFDYRIPPEGIESTLTRSLPFIIYPNPVKNKLILKLNSAQDINEIFISDVSGRIVYLENKGLTGDHFIIPVENLAFGPYIISVKGNDGNWSAKFVKQ